MAMHMNDIESDLDDIIILILFELYLVINVILIIKLVLYSYLL